MFIVFTELTIKQTSITTNQQMLLIFWDKVVKVCPQTKNYRSVFTGSSFRFDSKNQGVATVSSQVSGEELL